MLTKAEISNRFWLSFAGRVTPNSSLMQCSCEPLNFSK
jgi:hypothetical protein